jgi:Flp pilus assembly protein TadG
MRLRALRTLGQTQNGATVVEFALVMPLFLALLFGTLEFGRVLWIKEALLQTAIAGARCMALPQSACAQAATYTYSATKTTTYIQQVANQWGVSLPGANIIQNNAANCGGTGGFSEVSLAITFQSMVSKLVNISSGAMPLTATACFPNNP